MADRKFKPKDLEPYDGNNGRVNRCAQLMRAGKIRTGGTLLDVGGGIGDLGYAVRDLFARRVIFDISSKNLSAAEAKGNEVVLGDMDRGGLIGFDSDVDVITALDFIEHIIDPEHFARECHKALRPSGEVFINTPNIRFWRHIEQLRLQGTFPHTSGDREVFHGGHLAFYTYRDLRAIFEPAGFSSVQQIKDEECFEQPSPQFLVALPFISSQDAYVATMLEFGCPNLLYKAIVTK